VTTVGELHNPVSLLAPLARSCSYPDKANAAHRRRNLPRLRHLDGALIRAAGSGFDQYFDRTEIAAATAASIVGSSSVKRDLLPSMAAEDFACFLEQKPGT
jgi:hypothetical protein